MSWFGFGKEQPKYKISFIGAGDLAWQLGIALENAGHYINEIYSRNPKHAKAMAERLYGPLAVDTLDFSESDSELFIIAVPDDVIPEIAKKNNTPHSLNCSTYFRCKISSRPSSH